LERGGDGTALVYFTGFDYDPMEVSAGKLTELNEMIKQYGIKEWNREYETDEMAEDGDGYYLAIQYDNEYFTSSGYMAFPQNYEQARDAISAFFEGIESNYMEMLAEQRQQEYDAQKPEMIADVSHIQLLNLSYGNDYDYKNSTRYLITNTDDGLLLSYGIDDIPEYSVMIDSEIEQEVIELYKKHDVFSWDGFDEKDGGSGNFAYINDIFMDSRGRSFNIIMNSAGNGPEGFADFRDEISEYFDNLLGI
jgi:hypothetical protein